MLAGGLSLAYCFMPKKFLVNRGSTRYKSVFLPWCSSAQLLPEMFFLVSSVKELKTVHTRRLPNKKRQYPKSILNPQTAKPPHHMSEANITVVVVHEGKNRNKQNWNTNKHSTTSVPTIGTKMKGGTNEKSQEKDGEEDAPPACTANHSWSLTDICALDSVLPSTALYCVQLHCTTWTPLFYTVIRTWYTHYVTPHFKEGAGFIPVHVHVFVRCVCVYE